MNFFKFISQLNYFIKDFHHFEIILILFLSKYIMLYTVFLIFSDIHTSMLSNELYYLTDTVLAKTSIHCFYRRPFCLNIFKSLTKH